jgi:dynein heavy chain
MHILLLVWKNSKHYSKPSRLVVLMREVSNAIINQCRGYTSGEQLFGLVEAEQANDAVQQLRTTIRVCLAFKSTYFDYKATANAECPTNPWRVQNTAIFLRIDEFLERCQDNLDLFQTIVQFSKLPRIEIGGTKGKALTQTVLQVNEEFEQNIAAFRAVSYDIMDVDAKQFDDDFYRFRCRVKELDRRLGAVLATGFDDAATTLGRFQLLDAFDQLLERPIIADELEKKHVDLITTIGSDIKRVQSIFFANRENPTIGRNLPPIAGAIGWCRGLKERIHHPMECLELLDYRIREREEAREMTQTYVYEKYLRQNRKKCLLPTLTSGVRVVYVCMYELCVQLCMLDYIE